MVRACVAVSGLCVCVCVCMCVYVCVCVAFVLVDVACMACGASSVRGMKF